MKFDVATEKTSPRIGSRNEIPQLSSSQISMYATNQLQLGRNQLAVD